MRQGGSGDHAIHGFAHGDSLGAQRAVNLGGFDKDLLSAQRRVKRLPADNVWFIRSLSPAARLNG